MNDKLLIVGASARAAAFSARRAGLQPQSADLFADADLKQMGAAVRIERYPAGFIDEIRSAPPAPWMYTGALENYSRLVDRLATLRPLLGNSGDVLRRVRDPWQVAGALRQQGLPFPEISRSAPLRGDWLVKPLRSSAGLGIERAANAKKPPKGNPRACYYQRFAAGMPCSAAFVAARGEAVLLGCTRQLVGCRWAGAAGFRYCGSIGLLPLSEALQNQWRKIGGVLAAEFRLVGLFGVDAVLAGDEIWPLEINPRYTASLEVLERTTSISTVRFHVDACRIGMLPAVEQRTAPLCAGKAIVFAEDDLEVSEALSRYWLARSDNEEQPVLADIPCGPTRIARGHPILTVFAEGDGVDEVERRLQDCVQQTRNDSRSVSAK